ncbi:MOSC domain-containing protein [Chelativorans sp. YIM 93263]|uniref:MOSC domain-containing protein n=1 Tax=Chelativorans sp. YIM 93263 TaxID=2906648 RepID=UPI00237867E5|nr:molybdenum cofactor sulfurase [Chelativorans sp. YIM 93263]
MVAAGENVEKIVPAAKLKGRVGGLYIASHGNFQTSAVDALPLTFEGIDGDLHSGTTRRSGGREPWYKRGTEIRNERQLSIVAPDELTEAAARMGIAEIRPEWIGANLVIEDVPRLSMLPAGTLLFFEGGVTLKVDAQNGPCRIAGRAIAENVGMPDIQEGALLFPKMARRLRGIVAWVEKPGTITPGEGITLRIPEQWIYRTD